MKYFILTLIIATACACSNTSQQPLSINSPRLDSGISGANAGGLGGAATVGKSVGGAGTVNRVTAP